MATRGRGLFSLYIYIENFKNLLVRNHGTDFHLILQKCSFGDPLPRLFKPFGFVKKRGCQGAGLIFPICLYQGSGNFEIRIGPASDDDVINEPISKKKNIYIYHLSRKLMTIGSPITPFKEYTSAPLYDGSPGITSMIKAGVIIKYSQVCKKKEKKKKDGFVVISTSAGFS